MPENRDYVSNHEENGNINIAEDVVATIAAMAVGDIDGISGLYTSAGVDIAELLGKKNPSKGVRISIENDVVTVYLGVIVKYGAKIPETASALQRAVIAAIESMTGLRVNAVNITVGGIAFEPEKGPESEKISEPSSEESLCEEA